MVIAEIEKQFKDSLEGSYRMIEEYEELKRKVKPKIFQAGRELGDVAKLFSDFEH